MATFLSDQMFLPVMTALSASLIATVTDIRSLRIRNTLTVPLCLSGIVFHCWMGGWSGLSVSVAGIGIGFAVLILPYLMGILGAGDVKLLMGMGAWLGGHNRLPSRCLVWLFCYGIRSRGGAGETRGSESCVVQSSIVDPATADDTASPVRQSGGIEGYQVDGI